MLQSFARDLAYSLILLTLWSCAEPSNPEEEERKQLEEFSKVCENPDFMIWADANQEKRRDDVAKCADGGRSRFKNPVCPKQKVGNCPAAGSTGDCQRDSDCSKKPGGHCSLEPSNNSSSKSCTCYYPECSSDADCDEGSFCSCAGVVGGVCQKGNCSVWSDCGSRRCDKATYEPMANCGMERETTFACRTKFDTCFLDEDCLDKHLMSPVCAPNLKAGRWECKARPICD